MRCLTSSGGFITAATREEAAALAAQYGMGEIVWPAPTPKAAKPAKSMTLAQAKRVAIAAWKWPRRGKDWPTGSKELEADRVLREHGYDPCDIDWGW